MVVPVEHGTLNRGRLDHTRRHVCGTQIRAACLGSKFGLNIDTYVDLVGVAKMGSSNLVNYLSPREFSQAMNSYIVTSSTHRRHCDVQFGGWLSYPRALEWSPQAV